MRVQRYIIYFTLANIYITIFFYLTFFIIVYTLPVIFFVYLCIINSNIRQNEDKRNIKRKGLNTS